jgi:transformation/transcription domain-associated protein
MSRSNFERHAPKFIDPAVSLKDKLQLATEEVRDKIEIVHTSEYQNFLKAYFPVFQQLLLETKPQSTETVEHKLRNVLLEILNRLPHNEVLRPYVLDLIQLSMTVLKTDNEENAHICLRTIFDLHKNFRPSLETEVQPFLDFVCEVLKHLWGL